MIKAVIFDFDGTLVDLFDRHLEAFQETIGKHYNVDFTREDLDAGYGMTGEDILCMFFKKHRINVNKKTLKKIAAERRETAVKKIGEKIRLLPGARKLLEDLKKAGFKIAIATSCAKKVCDKIFAMPQFKGRLNAATTGTEVRMGKPHPEIFLKTAKKLGVKPEECVVFEDSAYGVKAGKRAGMKVIAVTTGHDRREKLMEEEPDRIIGSLLDFDINDIND